MHHVEDHCLSFCASFSLILYCLSCDLRLPITPSVSFNFPCKWGFSGGFHLIEQETLPDSTYVQFMTTVSFVLFCVVNALQKELISIFMWHVFASGTHKLSWFSSCFLKKLLDNYGCPSSIYRFWLPLWYFQTFLHICFIHITNNIQFDFCSASPLRQTAHI